MASNIDATKPATGAATTQSVRDNFLTAKNEISDLQLERLLRLESGNESTELFQQCAVSNTPQVVQFSAVRFINPNSTASFEFDSVNNEIVFNETGWYHVDLSLHVTRKTAGAGAADWSIFAQLKVPSGSFTNFQASRRVRTFDGTTADFKAFFQIGFVSKIEEAGTRLRWMQSCSDASKTVGIIGYPAAAPLPSSAGATFSIFRMGSL